MLVVGAHHEPPCHQSVLAALVIAFGLPPGEYERDPFTELLKFANDRPPYSVQVTDLRLRSSSA
jgi:hypothetical protein